MQGRRETQQGQQQGRDPRREEDQSRVHTQQTEWTRQQGQLHEQHQPGHEFQHHTGYGGGVTGPTGFGYSGGHETTGLGQETGIHAYESGGHVGVGYPTGHGTGVGVGYPTGGHTGHGTGVGVGYPSGGGGGEDYPSADPDEVIEGRGARAGRDIPTADPDVVEERKGATGRRSGVHHR